MQSRTIFLTLGKWSTSVPALAWVKMLDFCLLHVHNIKSDFRASLRKEFL